jgi:hypothetical protein
MTNINTHFYKDIIRIYQVLADLAFLTGSTVGISSLISAIREMTGPFRNVAIVDTLFTVYQFQYGLMLSCIVSLQLVQMLSVFFNSSINDWSENKVIMAHRLFVLLCGVTSSGTLCFLKGGMCRPTALYYYILQGKAGAAECNHFGPGHN